jgi:hypothetical protein
MQRVVFFLCFGHVKRPRDPSPSVSQAENEVERVPDGQRARWPERQGMFWRKWGARFLFPFFKRHILFVCERFGIARGSLCQGLGGILQMDAWTMGEAVIYVIWATKQLKLANCFFFPCYIYIIL